MNFRGYRDRTKFSSSLVILIILIAAGAVGIMSLAACSKDKEKQNMPSSRYSVSSIEQEDVVVYVLKDSKSKLEARIAPKLGNNCFSYTADVAGEQINILEPPPDLATLKGRASGYGIPILFPFPNRIREGKFSFEGKDYQFDVPRPGANSIHGLVLKRPWNVEKAEANDENGALLVSSIKCADFPDAIRQYPFPFNLRVTYKLKDGVLSMITDMENLGDKNMPMGYGIHPYFSAPLSKSSSPENCQIILPARKYWELEEFLPTGRILEVSGKYDLINGVPMSGVKFDDVFTDLIMTDGVSRCIVDDKDAKMRMILESDSIYREMVVYTPPRRGSICFEPYTCPTDAINLHQRGMDVGLIILKPGESVSATLKIIFDSYL